MSQTAVNRMTGARTQISGLVTAAGTLLTMLFLAPLLGLMPHAVLAGIVIVYSVGLIQPAEFRNILRIRRTEFIWAVAAFLGVMLIGTLQGILVAIIVSLVALAQQAANPVVHVMRPQTRHECVPRSARPNTRMTRSFPGLLLLRWKVASSSSMPSGSASRSIALIAEEKPKVVALDLQRRLRSRILGAEDADRRPRSAAAKRA